MLAMFLLLLMASSLMYFAERDAQPDAFASIPDAMWWGISTVTTVGYGDIYPVTLVGRLVASVVAVLGIGLFAIPTGILGAAFADEMARHKAGSRPCPHCGGRLGEEAE